MNNRMLKADAEIKRELGEILLFDMNDPRLNEQISITWVKTSSDFANCKVGISIVSNDAEQRKDILAILNKSSGYIKKLLAERVRMKAVPKIVFELDDGAVFSQDIDKILATLEIPAQNTEEEEKIRKKYNKLD